MTPAFFPAVRDAVRRLGDEGATRAMVISSTGKHFSAGMSLDVFAGNFPALAATTARERLAFQESLQEAHRLLQRPRRSALSDRLRDPGRLHRRRARPRDRVRHPRLQRRRVLHRPGDLDRHGRRPRRPAAPAEDRAAGRRARDGVHRRATRRRARARRRPRQRRAARRRGDARSRARAGANDRGRNRRSRSPAPSSRSTTRATTRPRRRCSR